MNILVTGGAGYIGSHTVVELINAHHNIIIVDNLCNSNIKVLDKIEQITNVRPIFYNIDILNNELLDDVFTKHSIDSVIHFAALKAVGESEKKAVAKTKVKTTVAKPSKTATPKVKNAGVRKTGVA